MLISIITLLIINVFVYQTVKSSLLKNEENNILNQANIISDIIVNVLDDKNITLNSIDLNSKLERTSQRFDGRILIINPEKEVIYDSFHNLKGIITNQSEAVNALKGEVTSNEYILEQDKNTLYTGVPIVYNNEIYGSVLISTSLLDQYTEINSVKYSIILISIMVLILIALMTIQTANSISEPIKKLTEAMQNAAYGKLNEKVFIPGNDEISQLAKSYNFMNTKLSEIEKQRREFVSNVSHELKTPLSSMKLLSESLLIQPNVDVDIYKDFLKDIDSEIDRLNKIIESLLSMVDIDEEKLNLDYKLTYVNYLVEKVINSITPIADKKNINITLKQIDKIQIYIDQEKIYRALTNIIHNAVKYTESEGKVEVSLFKKGQHAIIKISDNGIGIKEENIPYIFERFYRVDEARSRKTGGSGLGLAISQQIISLHQGSIEVESKVKEGTTFYIKLPIQYILGDKD